MKISVRVTRTSGDGGSLRPERLRVMIQARDVTCSCERQRDLVNLTVIKGSWALSVTALFKHILIAYKTSNSMKVWMAFTWGTEAHPHQRITTVNIYL